jgi:hypothetical protein
VTLLQLQGSCHPLLQVLRSCNLSSASTTWGLYNGAPSERLFFGKHRDYISVTKSWHQSASLRTPASSERSSEQRRVGNGSKIGSSVATVVQDYNQQQHIGRVYLWLTNPRGQDPFVLE